MHRKFLVRNVLFEDIKSPGRKYRNKIVFNSVGSISDGLNMGIVLDWISMWLLKNFVGLVKIRIFENGLK